MMPDVPEMPAWAALVTAALVLVGATFTLIGSFGLIRMRTFYQRLHAPSLGATLGTLTILSGSIVYFLVLQTRPVTYEVLIGLFITVTTPITFLLLAPATLYRDRFEGRDPLENIKLSRGDDE